LRDSSEFRENRENLCERRANILFRGVGASGFSLPDLLDDQHIIQDRRSSNIQFPISSVFAYVEELCGHMGKGPFTSFVQ
jgi:hypothetical protein